MKLFSLVTQCLRASLNLHKWLDGGKAGPSWEESRIQMKLVPTLYALQVFESFD